MGYFLLFVFFFLVQELRDPIYIHFHGEGEDKTENKHVFDALFVSNTQSMQLRESTKKCTRFFNINQHFS